MRKLDYLTMLTEINNIVSTDFCMEMECKAGLEHQEPFTQEEASQMAIKLSRVYGIAHGIDCVCGLKYQFPITKTKSK